MRKILISIFTDFINLILPNKCLTCPYSLLNGENLLCLSCLCEILNTEMNLAINNSELMKKLYGTIPIKYSISFSKFTKKSKIQNLIYNLKYYNKSHIGFFMGLCYGTLILKENFYREIDLIIPVPLHPKKLKLRGYNQSDFFAEGLSKSLSIEWNNKIIKRVVNTSTQTQKGDRWSRWQNINNAFKIENNKYLKGKHILLVDDVITSGSTLESCAKLLLGEGVRNVSIATLSYVEFF